MALAMTLLIAACAPAPTQIPRPASLTPYITSTPSLTPTPDVIVIIETPLPSATPIIYQVQTGDTMSAIAEKFKITLDDLMAANPEVSPNNMPIGTTLTIPNKPVDAANASTPTPVPVTVTQTSCYPTADRGLWCFALVHNDSSDRLENVSAQIALLDSQGAVIARQTAILPLDIVPPNTSLPLVVFFPPDMPASANVRIQILTANYSLPNDARYLPAAIHNTSIEINASGYSARVSGQVSLPAQSIAATQVWVAAVAYDKEGRVVGVKRWEGGALQPGGSIHFDFAVAGLGSAMDAVELFVEVR